MATFFNNLIDQPMKLLIFDDQSRYQSNVLLHLIVWLEIILVLFCTFADRKLIMLFRRLHQFWRLHQFRLKLPLQTLHHASTLSINKMKLARLSPRCLLLVILKKYFLFYLKYNKPITTHRRWNETQWFARVPIHATLWRRHQSTAGRFSQGALQRWRLGNALEAAEQKENYRTKVLEENPR